MIRCMASEHQRTKYTKFEKFKNLKRFKKIDPFPSRNSCRYAGVNNLSLYRVGRDGRIQACYADLYRP